MRLAAIFALSLTLAAPAGADEIVWGCDGIAGYTNETREYRHAVLGDDIEYKTLVLKVPTALGPMEASLDLPEGQVFEDIAPRCGDLDGDGEDDVVTIIADAREGARIAVYSLRKGPLGETPPIGQGFRWLAPIGVADFDGDGQNDIAYVETPHLGGTLRIWSFRNAELAQIASSQGFSNHRIGEDFITSGVRDCGDGVALVLPNFEWSALMKVRLSDGALRAEAIGDDTSQEAVAAALTCN